MCSIRSRGVGEEAPWGVSPFPSLSLMASASACGDLKRGFSSEAVVDTVPFFESLLAFVSVDFPVGVAIDASLVTGDLGEYTTSEGF